MKIEQIHDKGIAKINEDQILAKDNLFAVFDGVTGLDKFVDHNGMTGGYLASKIAKETFANESGSLVALATHANENIKKALEAESITYDKRGSVWCTAFAAVQLHEDLIEWAQIADCLIIAVYEDSFRLLGDYVNHDEDMLRKWKELGDITRDEKWEILQEDISRIRSMQNVDYGILNGEEKGLTFVQSGTLPKTDVKSLLLFTDGLIQPLEDFNFIVELFKKEGLEAVKNHIRDLENSDPECSKYPRVKKHDDIGAIAITF